MTDTDTRIRTLLGLISDRINEIKNPNCDLMHDYLYELETLIAKESQ